MRVGVFVCVWEIKIAHPDLNRERKKKCKNDDAHLKNGRRARALQYLHARTHARTHARSADTNVSFLYFAA